MSKMSKVGLLHNDGSDRDKNKQTRGTRPVSTIAKCHNSQWSRLKDTHCHQQLLTHPPTYQPPKLQKTKPTHTIRTQCMSIARCAGPNWQKVDTGVKAVGFKLGMKPTAT